MRKSFQFIGRFVYFIAWPFWFIYFKLTPARAKVVLRYGDQVLLIKNWIGKDVWSLPGGGSKRGEDLSQAAVRELFEEVQIRINADKLAFLGRQQVVAKGIKVDSVFYLCELEAKPAFSTRKIEVSQAKWFKVSELKHLKLGKQTRTGLDLALVDNK